MKKYLFKLLLVLGLGIMICSALCFAADDTDAIKIDSVTFSEYKTSDGVADDDFVVTTVKYTAAKDVSRITFTLLSENVEDSLAGKEAKVVYLDEIPAPQDGKYSFVIEKARVQSALGLENIKDIEGSTMYFKVGGTDVDEAALLQLVYNSPKDTLYGDVNGDGSIGVSDAVLALNHSVGNYEISEDKKDAADVDGSGKVGVADAVLILNYAVKNIDYDTMIAQRTQKNS